MIRYDFLWKDEARAGREAVAKDRPYTVVLVSRSKNGRRRDVVVCPITHAPRQRIHGGSLRLSPPGRVRG